MIIIIINQLDLDETMPEVITTLKVLPNLFYPALEILCTIMWERGWIPSEFSSGQGGTMDCYKKLEWPAEPVTLDNLVENNIWAIFKAILRGSLFCNFRKVFFKTKNLAIFVENRKCYRSPLLLRSRIMFLLFSKDFEVILKGVFVLYFWWGFVQNEDPGQIRWKPQLLSFPTSASG